MIGYIGEIAVCKWFDIYRVRYVHRVCTNGKSQPSELTVWRDGEPRKIEVKTAGEPFHQYLMWPAKQKLDFSAVIGPRVNSRKWVAIMGWLSLAQVPKMEIRKWESGESSRQQRFEDIEPEIDFIAKVDRGEGERIIES